MTFCGTLQIPRKKDVNAESYQDHFQHLRNQDLTQGPRSISCLIAFLYGFTSGQ